jgi:hypothetical protein
VHARGQDEPVDLHQEVALAPGEPLRPIVAALGPARPAGLDRLAVDHRRAGVPGAPFTSPDLGPERVVRSTQPAVQAPPAEVVVHGLPGWVLPREHPPGTAAPQEVEHGVGDAPGGPIRRPAAPLGGREKWLQQGPLFVGKV